MKRDDLNFLGAVAATLLLAGALVWSVYLKDQSRAAGPVVDVKRIEKLAGEGRVSLHEASFWEPAAPREDQAP
jgi:hypothetical protein